MITYYNDALDMMLSVSPTWHQLGLSLTVFSIMRLRSYLTPLTYALYYFMFAQITTYTLKAYFTLGAIPSSTTAFLKSWKRGLTTRRERKVLKTFRAQGMDMNGFCRLRKSQLPLMVHIGVNLIILFLEI
jgi:hypothetical protein